MSQDQRLYDFFDGDPDYELEYHQDYREDPLAYLRQARVVVPLLLAAVPIIYQTLYIVGYDLLPIPELLWNILVYLTPSRLLDAAETYKNPLRIANPMLRNIPRTHAAKSEAMRRILGVDKAGGIMGSVAQAGRRRLSTLPGMNLGPQAAEGRPAGLGNWDNSCYQNSVLQGLASLDSLSGYLTNPAIEMEAIDGVSKPDMKMAEALWGLIATLNDPSNNGRRIWTPATLKNMSSWQQQDAQEYFSKVLDEIDKEIDMAAKLMNTSQGLEKDESSSGSGSSEPLPISTFRNPLEGLIAQRVGCTKCGYSEGLSMIPFNCLTVPLGRLREYDVAECLDEYTKLELIEGVECGKCTLLKSKRQLATILERVKDIPDDNLRKNATERLAAVTEALEEDDYEEKTLLNKCKISPKSRLTSIKTRQAVIARPPKSLVVHFNRSLFDEMTGELRKNYSDVRFPKVLDLGPWCLGSSGSSQDLSAEEWLLDPDKPMIASTATPSRLYGPLYELRAVVTHYGRHENGHYICYKKHPSHASDEEKPVKEHWWRLSDDDVMKVSEENVLDQGGVFMLFFDLIRPATSFPSRPMVSKTNPVTQASSAVVELAASVPLPDLGDSDLSDLSDSDDPESILLTTCEESIATSVSEYDCEEDNEHNEQQYTPTRAILVPPYIQQTRVHNENEEARKQGIVSSGNLVMV